MKKGKFKAIIYLISFTVLVTVSIQVYRNIQNYHFNKQQLINDVQLSLDNAIEAYYADQAKDNDYFRFITRDSLLRLRPAVSGTSWVSISSDSDSGHVQQELDSMLRGLNIARSNSLPNMKFTLSSSSTAGSDTSIVSFDPNSVGSIQIFRDTTQFRRIANNLIVSMAQPLQMDSLGSYVKKQLTDKGLEMNFALEMSAFGRVINQYNDPEDPQFVLSILPKSTYQTNAQKLEMRYTDISMATLRRSITDLVISMLISITVIGALLYLYRVINQQKQLAEIKNDLISNITHEFKTPIATVASALEGIANFNERNDPAKTRKYLDISSEQLKKLNLMVEKLLETATLETDALELNRSPVNLSQLLDTLIEKYRLVSKNKTIHFTDHVRDAIVEADAFHLENALGNLIDNAVKYGGDQISVTLAHQEGTVQVVVQDNGGFIEKSQKERVFDKFYRIPKGNQHDVKGFGIGLYYTRKIIEKHGGSIVLILSPGQTSFEVAI